MAVEWSKDASITQFKSPPNIRRWVSRQGILLRKMLSELGAYTFTRITGVCQRLPVIIKYLPFLSEITLEAKKMLPYIFLPIKIVTPLALESKPEWKT